MKRQWVLLKEAATAAAAAPSNNSNSRTEQILYTELEKEVGTRKMYDSDLNWNDVYKYIFFFHWSIEFFAVQEIPHFQNNLAIWAGEKIHYYILLFRATAFDTSVLPCSFDSISGAFLLTFSSLCRLSHWNSYFCSFYVFVTVWIST